MIIQEPHPTLRQVAKPVPVKDIGSPEIKKIIADMKDTLDSTADGVAIAAPQINESVRIFVVSQRVFNDPKIRQRSKERGIENHPDLPVGEEKFVYINPVIKKLSTKKSILSEGCLSLAGLYGKIRRADKALVEAYDEDGKKFSRGGSGLLAEIFQHEIDHLDGILFIDTAKNVREVKRGSEEHEEE